MLTQSMLTLTMTFLWSVFICMVLLRVEELYRLQAIPKRIRPGLEDAVGKRQQGRPSSTP